MHSVFSLLSLCIVTLFGGIQEPSAFGAGDLDAPNPYGLSSTEKHIVKNQKDIKRLQNVLMKQQAIVQENRERLDGLQSVLEDLNKQMHSIKGRFGKFSDINKSIVSLNKKVDTFEQSQSENFKKMHVVLKELSSILDSINEKYVDKEQFLALERSFLSFKSSYEKFARQGDLSGKSNAQVYKDAKEKFAKKLYLEATIYFEHLIKNHYKPATSNYYLGEIAYRQKRYKDAVAYYKQSASLYDKSSFMPTLLLHTAISLGQLGKKQEAKNFYETLIQLYPESKLTTVAKKNLKKLK